MIERYTIKFGPAVSQKELEKALHAPSLDQVKADLGRVKARIEVVCEFSDLRELEQYLKGSSGKVGSGDPT
jgi:hypothetical protein